MPEDVFSGGPFRYKREGAGYLLYTVGPIGKDDGGRAYWNAYSHEPDGEDAYDCDAIAVRVPAKKR